MTGRRPALVSGILAGGLILLLGVLVQWPMAQVVRFLPASSGGTLLPVAAHGRWHDGMLHLGCATPGGRLFDCGRYQVSADPEGMGLAINLRQTGGGGLLVRLESGGWRVQANDWRIPAAALAAWLPVVEQMQMAGAMQITGRAEVAGKTDLDVRWQGEIAEFFIGEQAMHIKGSGGRFNLDFGRAEGTARAAYEPSSVANLEGGVICEFSNSESAASPAKEQIGTRGARCQGDVFLVSSGADEKLEQFLMAVGQKVAPGRYRFRVDSQ